MSRLIGFRVMTAVAAAVLGVAGVLKLVAIVTIPAWRTSAVIAPAIMPFLACAEICAAILLGRAAFVRGGGHAAPGAVWLLATLIFGVFGVCACGLVMAGYQSCNCFGGWAASPRIALAIDVSLLVGLTVFRPVPAGEAVRQAVAWVASRPAAAFGTWGGIAASVLMASVAVGDPRILDAIRGRTDEAVQVAGGAVNVGVVATNSVRIVGVTLENRTAATVEIVGATASCSCTSTIPASSFPLTLAPYGSITLPVQIRFPPHAGPFQVQCAYFLRHPHQYRAVGTIVATVGEPSAQPVANDAGPAENRNQESIRDRESHQDDGSS